MINIMRPPRKRRNARSSTATDAVIDLLLMVCIELQQEVQQLKDSKQDIPPVVDESEFWADTYRYGAGS